jgi:hypothetical protein
MAHEHALAERQDGRHLVGEWRQRQVPDRVHAPVPRDEPPPGDAIVDRARPEPEGEQLPALDLALLPSRERPDLTIQATGDPENDGLDPFAGTVPHFPMSCRVNCTAVPDRTARPPFSR